MHVGVHAPPVPSAVLAAAASKGSPSCAGIYTQSWSQDAGRREQVPNRGAALESPRHVAFTALPGLNCLAHTHTHEGAGPSAETPSHAQILTHHGAGRCGQGSVRVHGGIHISVVHQSVMAAYH